MKIEIILLGVIGLVFLVDFIMNSRKKPSIDNVVDQIEGGEPVKTNNPLNYLLKRKKNFTIYILSIPVIKVLLHYLLYPIMNQDTLKRTLSSTESDLLSEKYRASIGDHLDLMFTDEIWLFIPAFILVSLLVWFFNDKIKAR